MRQPEVAGRLGLLLLAVALVLPVARTAWDLVRSGAFLVEFLRGGTSTPLTGMAPTARFERDVPGSPETDRFFPESVGAGRPLVLVHGFAPRGRHDPRARWAAVLLARAGFDVLLPTIPGLTVGRLGPDDVERVVAAIARQRAPTAVLAVSVGSGPALLAAADPRVRDRISVVACLGGYASATELLRFFLTGAYDYGEHRGRVDHDPETIRAFVRANADLLDPPTYRVLLDLDPSRTATVLDHLSPAVTRRLEALSPERVAAAVPAPLLLVHGRADPAVPWTESLRLAAARRGRPTLLALVGIVGHVEGPGGAAPLAQVRDLLALWRVMYALMAAGA